MWLDNDKNTNQECLRACTMSTPLIRFFFPRNVVCGEIASVERENVKNIQKQTKFVIVWVGGGNLELRWGIFSPLEALKKKTLPLISLSLFGVTMLKYYVGCKSQKATTKKNLSTLILNSV